MLKYRATMNTPKLYLIPSITSIYSSITSKINQLGVKLVFIMPLGAVEV